MVRVINNYTLFCHTADWPSLPLSDKDTSKKCFLAFLLQYTVIIKNDKSYSLISDTSLESHHIHKNLNNHDHVNKGR